MGNKINIKKKKSIENLNNRKNKINFVILVLKTHVVRSFIVTGIVRYGS